MPEAAPVMAAILRMPMLLGLDQRRRTLTCRRTLHGAKAQRPASRGGHHAGARRIARAPCLAGSHFLPRPHARPTTAPTARPPSPILRLRLTPAGSRPCRWFAYRTGDRPPPLAQAAIGA